LRRHRHEKKFGGGGHRVAWDEAMSLETESNSRYKTYKESPHMAYLTNVIRQPSLDPSLAAMRLPTHREDLYDVTDSSWVSIRFSPKRSIFTLQMAPAGRHKMVSQKIRYVRKEKEANVQNINSIFSDLRYIYIGVIK
jgi:hypothetical protein